MGQSQEPQRIPEEREFLHELSNPLTTALALAAKSKKFKMLAKFTALVNVWPKPLNKASIWSKPADVQ